LKGLMESIEKYGVIHPPVVVPREDGNYDLVAGERRLRSMILLGWKEVPVTFRDDLNEIEKKEVELEENLRRQNLEWTEEIELIRQIDEVKRTIHGSAMPGKEGDKGWSQEKTAELIGKSKAAVQMSVQFSKLLNARPDIKEMVKGMPLTVAMRVAEKKLEGEELKRQADAGKLKVSAKLLNGDARELIKSVQSDSIGLIITDPPFGIPQIESMEGEDRGSVQSYTSKLKHTDNLSVSEAEELMKVMAQEMFRVLKPASHIYVFFGFELYHQWFGTLCDAGFDMNPVPIIWSKGKTTVPFRGYDYAACYEPVLFGHKPPRERRLEAACSSIIEFSPDHSKLKLHPFQKPQLLLEYFIKQSSRLGEVVLDPFAGSGATLVASIVTGREALGFELNEEHYLASQKLILDVENRLVKKEEGK